MIPQLRFPEFTDEWQLKKLGDLFEIKSASRVHKDEWAKSGVPFFRSSDVVARFKGEKNTDAFIPVELFEKLSSKSGRIKKGDLLVTGGGSIGIPYLVESNEPLYFKDADLIWIKHSLRVVPFFLYSFLVSPEFRRYLRSISHIGTIGHYTIEQAKMTPMPLASIEEQEKIVDFLKAVDERIAVAQKKLKLLETYKRGVMQKIFNQQIRFKDKNGNDYPEWKERKLGSLLVKNKTRNRGLGISYVQSVSNKRGFVSQDEYFDGASIASKNTSNYFVIEKGTFAYNPSRINVGSLAYKFDQTTSIVSPLYVSFKTQNMLLDGFLLHWFATELFIKQMHRSFEGSVRDTLSFEALSDMDLNLPSNSEQQKIATFLTAIDEKITTEQTKLTTTRQFKKALLQRMFV